LSADLLLGVQVQGGSYRMLMEWTRDRRGSKFEQGRDRLFAEKKWFGFYDDWSHSEEYPRGEKKFNQFGESFFYRSVNINPTMTASELVEMAVADVLRARGVSAVV